jgi:hypothetical protein
MTSYRDAPLRRKRHDEALVTAATPVHDSIIGKQRKVNRS